MAAPASLVPIDAREGSIWMDGEMRPWREATIHVLTHGLHYGSGVFEGARRYGGRIFKLTEHSERLVRSAEILDFTIPYTVAEIDAACNAAAEATGLEDCYVRPIAWRGSEALGVSAPSNRIHLAVACWAWPSYFDPEQKARGIRLADAVYRRPAPDTAPTASKACGLYMICTISKHAAERAGYADALMLDYRGLVAEATGANVFFVRDGVIHTPVPDCFLDGITRRTVIGLAQAKGLQVIERQIRPEEMADMDECFITGTAAEVTPVREAGRYSFTPGPVGLGLMTDYAALVRGGSTG